MLGFLVVLQMMAIDCFAPRCVSWFSCDWKTGEAFPSEECLYVVREHGHITEQVFLVGPATTFDLSIRVEAGR